MRNRVARKVAGFNAMLPLLRESPRMPDISIVYCGWSTVVSVVTASLLFSSRKYLKFGELEILPLYGFYALSELIKWAFINCKFVLSPPYKARADSRGVGREIIEQVKNLSAYNMAKSSAVFICGVLFYYAVAVMFGAALLEGRRQTFLFSLLMTVLTVMPVCLHLGHESAVELVEGVVPEFRFERTLYRGVVATWLGAWLGALVLPLDWGRPWQIWPVPCSYGAVLALSVYHCVSSVYLAVFHTRSKTF